MYVLKPSMFTNAERGPSQCGHGAAADDASGLEAELR
jgi:hypothetical protein